jgi:hypothetical protein
MRAAGRWVGAVVVVGIGASAWLANPATALAACSQMGGNATCSFSYTGGEQTLAVPPGVTSVTIEAVGASGGGNAGGAGGAASATATVTAGSTLYVEVGGQGTASAGGFNGGGAPGTGASAGGAGGGGGASDVRTVCMLCANSLGSRLVVAAGGGGSGASGIDSGALARGGAADAGGQSGRDSGGDASDKGGGAGGAGTASSGGVLGAGGAADAGGMPGSGGATGAQGLGGGGGGGSANTSGGGGGGGYWAGGGGGGGGASTGHQGGGGGGGGGSCYALAPTGCGTPSSPTASVTISYALPDTTAPVISIVAPAANAVYPLGATTVASYECADEAGGSGLVSCQGPVSSGGAIDTGTPGPHTFTVSAVDNAGNRASQTVNYIVASPPSASVAVAQSGGIYARGQVVDTSFSCVEAPGGPGIVTCGDSNGLAASPGLAPAKSEAGQLDTATIGRHTYTVSASSGDGLTATTHVTYTVAAPPSVSITAPAAGKVYWFDQGLRAMYGCKDGAYGPGLRSCRVTPGTGSRFEWSKVGPDLLPDKLGIETFTVTAVSKDGQKTSKTVRYGVGLFAPSGPVVSRPRYVLSVPGSGSWSFAHLHYGRVRARVCRYTHLGPGHLRRSCGPGWVKALTLLTPTAPGYQYLQSWYRETRQGMREHPAVARRTVTLEVVAPSHPQPLAAYTLENTWVVRYSTRGGVLAVSLMQTSIVRASGT